LAIAEKTVAGCQCGGKTMRDMKAVLLLIGIIFLSGCASGPDDPDQVQLGPSLKQQQREAHQREDFARSLPQPHP
jgi:hypothetical protein